MMIKFSKLWNNFPDKESVKNICTNKQTNRNKPFDNYCAILLSECFIKSGIDINFFWVQNVGLIQVKTYTQS